MSAPPGPVAQIDLAALRGNFALARRLAGGRDVIAVVKADAYGHGALAVTRALVGAGCARFAVARVAEAVALRDAGIAAQLLVLGGCQDAAEAEAAVAHGLVPVLHDAGGAERLAAAARARGKRADAHLEIDTGMRRAGPGPEAALTLARSIRDEPALALAGVFTHFARADEPDLAPSRAQLRAFRRFLAEARDAGPVSPSGLCVHVANSAALLVGDALAAELPEATAVRPGILLYGISPFAPPARAEAPLRPVLRLVTRVVDVHAVETGDAVGYGGTYRAPRATRIATLAIGYADGVPWSLANRGSVLVRGRPCAIVGRISMDLVTVDAGALPVERGDEAVLIGEQAGAEGVARRSVEELAADAGTLAYELVSRLGPRVARIVRDEGAATDAAR